MSEEIKTSPDIVPDSNTAEPFAAETLAGEEPQPAASAAQTARKSDPWKTAFIVLTGIAVVSAGVFYIVYARKNDLPTTPAASAGAADANAQPVQMANPPTGASEQIALSQPVPQSLGNAAGMAIPPGDGGYDPWANPGRFQQQQSNSSTTGGPYQVYPAGPPGQQVYMESNPNSPFMSDGNTYIMVPANTASANANRAASSNSNTKIRPSTSPTPAVTVPPTGNTAIPTTPKTDAPAANKPATKPAPKKPAGKQNGTTSGKPAGKETRQDT
jgi:hypothetical protein